MRALWCALGRNSTATAEVGTVSAVRTRVRNLCSSPGTFEASKAAPVLTLTATRQLGETSLSALPGGNLQSALKRKERSMATRAEERSSRWGGRGSQGQGWRARLQRPGTGFSEGSGAWRGGKLPGSRATRPALNPSGGAGAGDGYALQSGVEQLRGEGKEVPAKVMAQVAERADDFGAYLQSAQADQMLMDLERFARRRPWVTAGVGVLAGFVASRFVKASADRRYEGSRSGDGGYARRRSGAFLRGCVDDERR